MIYFTRTLVLVKKKVQKNQISYFPILSYFDMLYLNVCPQPFVLQFASLPGLLRNTVNKQQSCIDVCDYCLLDAEKKA